MDWFFKMPSTLKFIFWLILLICCVCSCNEKKISVERGSQEKVVSQEEAVLTNSNSINIKSPKGGEPKDNIEEFEKLKKIISENLPNIEKQLQEALGSPVKLKMVIEDKPETAVSELDLNEKLKDVKGKLEQIPVNSTEKEKIKNVD